MVTKAEQQQHVTATHENLTKLASSYSGVSDQNMSGLRDQLNNINQEIQSLDGLIKEQILRVQGNIILDMNLEKGRIMEEMKELQGQLKDIQKNADAEIDNLNAKAQEINRDLRRTINRMLMLINRRAHWCCVCFFHGIQVVYLF
jgi:formate-dependent nitrite reductase cytochrome c552 subunit